MAERVSVGSGTDGWARLWEVQRYGLAALVFLNFFPPAHGPTRYLFFSLLGLAVVALVREKAPFWIRTPIDVPLLGLLAWILITIPFSIDPAYSFKEWRKLGAQVLLFYWAIRVLHAGGNDRLVSHVLTATVLGAAITAGYAIVEFFRHGGASLGRELRAAAVGSDYNWLSTYMIMAIPLVLTFTVVAPARWLKALGIGTAGLAFGAEMAAYTRAGWMGLVAEALTAVWLTGKRWLMLGMVAALLVVGIGAVAVLDFHDRGETSEVSDPWTFKARLAVWKLAAQDLLEHPVVGVGYGNYNFVKRYEGRPELEKAHGPHSTVIVMGLGSGLPALGLFVWLLMSIILTLTRFRRMMTSPPDILARMVPFGVALMVVGFTVRNLFDYMLIGGLANLFWMLVAVALSVVDRTGGESGPGPVTAQSDRLAVDGPHAS